MTTFTTTSVPSRIDATPITVYAWQPQHMPRSVVQISHGVAEHALRYDRLARALTAADYAVYAHDHRGHGTSISEEVTLGGFWSGRMEWPGFRPRGFQRPDSSATTRPTLVPGRALHGVVRATGGDS